MMAIPRCPALLNNSSGSFTNPDVYQARLTRPNLRRKGRMPRPASVNLHRVARQVGIVLRESADHSPTSVRPRHCFCKPTLRAIGLAHGEAHLAIVLRLIVETKGNAAELHAATIKAVSAVVDSGLVDVDGALFEAMDGIDLRKLRLWSQAARVARAGGGRASVVDTMAAALLWQLASPEKLKVAA